MNSYSLNLDVLYHIAEKYPSINLTLVNKDMKACIDKIFELAVNYIVKELPSFMAELSLDKSTMNGMEYFTKLTDELCLEGKRLGIRDLVLGSQLSPTDRMLRIYLDSQLSPADRMIRNYFIFRKLVENIKVETSKAKKEDFNKFVEAVLKEINYPLMESKDLTDVWNDLKSKDLIASVKGLDLSNQNMRFLPREIGDLNGLWRLNLNNNKLSFIPEEFNYLSNLSELEMRNNNLREVPNVNNFPKLINMNLMDNKIINIPSSSLIDSHLCLESIYLHKNPITDPSKSIILHHKNIMKKIQYNPQFEDG